ncbi:MAG: DUF4238 domain-containing protein [Bryobacteraceae bacterium]
MANHHYVSKFHLREFCDLSSLATPNPWLWLGGIGDGSVKRKSPKNVGTAPDMFDGPGGLWDGSASLENFLANEVEGPAALALRNVVGTKGDDTKELSAPLLRYLAWAAARSLPMQRLEVEWAKRFGKLLKGPMAELPPNGLNESVVRRDSLRLIHPTTGASIVTPSGDANNLLDVGWIPDPSEQANFLEGAHIQAYYFQVRWFPRLNWTTLRPPAGAYFIIGDPLGGVCPIAWMPHPVVFATPQPSSSHRLREALR